MERSRRVSKSSYCSLVLYLFLIAASSYFPHSAADARKPVHVSTRSGVTHSIRSTTTTSDMKPGRKVVKALMKITTPILPELDDDDDDSSTNAQPYAVSSPFSLPPFDSLAPIPLPETSTTPPFCEYPPSTPQLVLPNSPPSISINPSPPIGTGTGGGGFTPTIPPPSSSTPTLPIEGPPPSPIGTGSSPPISFPSPNPPPPPPGINIVPSPSGYIPNPPIYIPSPSGYIPNPPIYIPSPTEPILTPPNFNYEPSPPFGFVPTPPVFQPPVVYPPPTVPPPPPNSGPSTALWCVAKPSVPDPIIEEAMNYACGSGADCDSLQPNEPCFQPNTLFAHASYAFNSYWQRTKVAGGTCEFGGSAILVTVDPSYDGCHFVYY